MILVLRAKQVLRLGLNFILNICPSTNKNQPMRKRIWYFLTILCLSSLCTAQQVVSSGGYVKKAEASIDWIIGGSLSDLSAFSLNYLTFDQMKQFEDSAFYVNIFPNPSRDLLNIEIAQSDTGRLVIQIIDLQGRTLLSMNPVKESLTQLDVSHLSEGAYYLKINQLSDDRLCRIEKIIKVKK